MRISHFNDLQDLFFSITLAGIGFHWFLLSYKMNSNLNVTNCPSASPWTEVGSVTFTKFGVNGAEGTGGFAS